MHDCQNLTHPFLNDPGVSQAQRAMKELLEDMPSIDGRSLADLLQYFVQLSGSINFYDEDLGTTDWREFFNGSLPFQLAAMSKTQPAMIRSRFDGYDTKFAKNPSAAGLQLNLSYAYSHTIRRIDQWHRQLAGSKLSSELVLTKLIRNKLRQPLRKFIGLYNAGVKYYNIRKLDFSGLAPVWELKPAELHTVDNSFLAAGFSDRKRLLALERKLNSLFPLLSESLGMLTLAAEKELPGSLLPTSVELSEKHTPHLALVFVFIKMFQQLQTNLNGFTRKHLDFFYRDVLRLKPKAADGDRVHILFELQNQLQNHLIAKGSGLKAGKDDNKMEMVFAVDDDLVVNRTTVKEVRSLYLNNQSVQGTSYLEGVYMAPNAQMADGLDKPFREPPTDYPTLGSNTSKYLRPGTDTFSPYPGARLGFAMASTVLLLNEGKRTVNITLACQLFDPTIDAVENICRPGDDVGKYPGGGYSTSAIFNKIKKLIQKYYVFISMELVAAAEEKGISRETIRLLKDKFLADGSKTTCGVEEPIYTDHQSVTYEKWWSDFYNAVIPAEKEVIDTLFPKTRVLKIAFSGAKEWIEPTRVKRMRFTSLVTSGNKMTFAIKLKCVLDAGKPALTWYDKLALGEDLQTSLPVARLLLDDRIKIRRGIDLNPVGCCLDREIDNGKIPLSFYYFMRNLKVIEKSDPDTAGNTFTSGIDVKVCGLKNVIVQNTENVMDVNSPMFPFGTIPRINNDFYIGSKEIFCKKWQEVSVNLLWKDKPMNLQDCYHGYEDNTLNITKDDFAEKKFRFDSAVLSNRSWFENNNERVLFRTDHNHFCLDYPFVSGLCGDPTDMFRADGWVKRSCVKWQYINHECLAATALNPDGTINPAVIAGEIMLPNAFKPIFIDTTPADDFIDYSCVVEAPYTYTFTNTDFGTFQATNKDATFFVHENYSVNASDGFLRLRLQGQDFQHDRYSYVLTRQMLALGNFPRVYVGPVYDGYNPLGTMVLPVMSFDDLFKAVEDALKLTQSANPRLKTLFDQLRGAATYPPFAAMNINLTENQAKNALGNPLPQTLADANTDIPPATPLPSSAAVPFFDDRSIDKIIKFLEDGILVPTNEKINNTKEIRVVIPKPPYALQIKTLSLDYTATAGLEDIDLIHLYPFAGTNKKEEIRLQPTLFPSFCDEGTLFIGLESLVPGENLNILFQLAEATSDSESDPEDVHWHSLQADQWKPLRPGFEVLDDGTENLTSTGIIKFSLPETMTDKNSIMPRGIFWIKATIPKNSGAVSETTGIFAQAVSAGFVNREGHDQLRLGRPLPSDTVNKLLVPDSGIKALKQPYASFGGTEPEAQQQYYTRVSELLRHKGRAIQKFDYERIALEAFPQVFKAKCINHSFALNAKRYTNDFPIAPGYVTLAVIPDLNRLKAGNSFEPKAPVSLLVKIEDFLRQRTSPFVRFRVMNPRYEPVHFSITVKLLKGKDKVFFREQLRLDIRTFMAPWAIGEFYKLTFGQCVNRSQIIEFIETRDYVDFILELKMHDEQDRTPECEQPFEICPVSPRSILIAGDVDVCIAENECEHWGREQCKNPAVPIIDYCK
ncbi:MAG: hypothetical protein EOO09_03295 [Chitinophagaceae bacterium]|nr:MAG: hypothetical protein EOO09_03295 [Chitinophagaceae bacterium]